MVTAAAAAFFSCADLGGIGHEGEAKISGQLQLLDGTPAAQTLVSLFPADYDPVKDAREIPFEMTDAQGNYLFTQVSPGDYILLAKNTINGIGALISGIHSEGKDVGVPKHIMFKAGAMKVYLPSGVNGATGYAYLPGTALFTFLNNRTDFVVIDSIPAGVVPEVVYSSTNGTVANTIRYNVSITSNDTAVVRNPAWKHVGDIILNTSATGANVVSTVTNFPVLVRLSSANFNFSQAQPGGTDIRFAKIDNTFLPYEIERWDDAGRQAEIWVKVDTVRGNDSIQSIIIYWGNADAHDASNGAAVFDTAAGFQGVWHLDESSGNAADATINSYNGSTYGSQMRIPGAIGYGQHYGGSGDYTDMGNVCNPGTSGFTVSAWIKAGVSKSYRTVVSKSVGGNPSSSYGWLLELDPNGSLLVFMATDTGAWGDQRTFILGSKTLIADSTAWHHVAAVVDRSGNNNCKIYIDGSDASSYPAAGDITKIGAVVNSTPLRFGIDGKGGGPWRGSVDECSISFTPRSQDWIKLCFMNQRSEGRLVFFKTNGNN